MESFDLAHFYSNNCDFNDKFYLLTDIFAQKSAQFYFNLYMLLHKKLPRSPYVKCFIFEQKWLHDLIIHIVE